MPINWKLNTSNKGKFEEFQRLFNKLGIDLNYSETDLKEIDADPITVIAHKASQVEPYTLVDDTSLDITGVKVGIHVRWLLEHLKDYLNREAVWTVLLAYREGRSIFIYKGTVLGKIVPKSGDLGFGFDPFFMPKGSLKTLAEFKPDKFNARAHAVNALMQKKIYKVVPEIQNWEGPWQ